MSSRFGFSSFNTEDIFGEEGEPFIPLTGDGKYPSVFSGFAVPGKKVDESNVIQSITRVVWLMLEVEVGSTGWYIKYSEQGNEELRKKKFNNRSELDAFLTRAINFNWDEREGVNHSKLSEKTDETHLSINGENRQLVIISLPTDFNMQFNRAGAGISTSVEQSNAFLETGLVHNTKPQATIEQPDSVTKRKAGGYIDGCKTAYFIVDPKVADIQRGPTDGTSQTDIQMPKDYKAFNIHLDLVGKRTVQDSTGKPADEYEYYIPIIIDPDVRHPGGFGGG